MSNHWLIGAIVFAGTAILLWSLKRVLFRLFFQAAARTESGLDDLLVHSLSLPLNFVVLLIAAWTAQMFLSVPPRLEPYLQGSLKTLFVLAAIIFADRFLVGSLSRWQQKSQNTLLQSSSSLIRALTHALVYGLGLLVLLDSAGVSITPLIASLGIGSLAVALALQDTLSNFFSGLYLLMDRPLEVGHFVKLESGDEGFVHKIGWRSTRIRTLPNNIVVIPNTKIANSHFTNFSMPDPEMAVLVQVGVAYASDLGRVEKITVEVAREILRTAAGGVTSFDPFIRFHTFGDSGIQFTVILRAKQAVDQHILRHEFVKALHERYRREGIQIPFPVRTLDIPERLRVSVARE